MWSIGLLAYSWLFLQTIGSAHFSRGMSSDRPVEQLSAPLYHSTNEIRIIVNYSETESGRRGYRGVDHKIWQTRNLEQNHLLHPHPSQLRSYDTNLVSGQLVIVRSASPKAGKSVSRSSLENAGDACGNILNPGRRPWIAVVKASNRCDNKKKIRNLFHNSNASGVIIYGNEGVSAPKNSLHSRNTLATATGAGFGSAGGKSGKRGTSRSRRLAVWVKYSVLADVLARCNATTECNATLIVTVHPTDGLINRTSVLFVSISFILLMIISLAWLVFYYVQRFRYIHAKERLSRRLANAAKKALTKIPVKTLLRGDTETENEYDQCAVCIEQYKPSDTIRILPCRHYFHKSCIDPWLLEQRSCPMCKLDILKAYGLQVRGFSEGPSDTLVEHSDMNALGRATSVSLEVTVRETTTAGGEESTTGGGDEEAGGVTTRLVSDEGQSDSSSPGCSTSGARVTIEPPEVQYHHPGANVKVVVEQHAPVEDEEEDEEEAVSRPLFAGGAETKEVVATECI